MVELDIRVGLIGAGGNVRNRHIPGFQKVDGVEIVAVANRSDEAGRAIADQFDIPRVYASWRELLEDDDINSCNRHRCCKTRQANYRLWVSF